MQKLQKSMVLAALIVMVGAGAAWADATCPGIGNDCSSSITNQGGAGGNASANAAAAASSSATAVANPVQVTTQGQQQGQQQEQLQGQGQLQGQKQGQVNQPNQTIEGDNVRVYATPPAVIAPALAVAPETCMGSVSSGISGGNGMVGVGLSFGSTWKSESCERRMFARSLVSLGPQYATAALALLAQDENVARALKAAGVTVPVQKVELPDTKLKLNTPLGEEPKTEKKKSEPSNFGQRTSMTIPEALVANLAAQQIGVGQ